LKCFDEVERRDSCLDKAVKLMFVCEEGRKEERKEEEKT